MKLLPKRFYSQRERWRARHSGQDRDLPHSSASSTDEAEVERLATLARSLQRVTPMQVDTHFADLLEEQLLAAAARQAPLRQATKKERWERGDRIASRKLTMMHPRAAIACFCLLLLCLGAGVLVLRPLPQKTAHTTVKQVELTDQAAHTQLSLLASLAEPAHDQAYRGALAKLDQQIAECTQEVAAVPHGSDWDRAEQALAQLKTDTRQVLSRLLPGLALPERMLTTTELGKVGAPVPVVQSALFTLTPSSGQATVFLRGSGIQPGAHVLIDNQEISMNGVAQNGGYEITIPWSAQRPVPQHLGILNKDNTAAQTATLTIQVVQVNNNGGRDDGGGGHGRGRDGGHGRGG